MASAKRPAKGPVVRDWGSMRAMSIRLLHERTGQGLDHWLGRIRKKSFASRDALAKWLESESVTGYARMMLVDEIFGYPEFATATSEELLDGQYRDRPSLRPIYDAILAEVGTLGPLTVQMRKTYVSLVSPKRTFARIRPTTRTRVDLGLKVDGVPLGGRIKRSRIHESLSIELEFTRPEEFDREAAKLLRRAYRENL